MNLMFWKQSINIFYHCVFSFVYSVYEVLKRELDMVEKEKDEFISDLSKVSIFHSSFFYHELSLSFYKHKCLTTFEAVSNIKNLVKAVQSPIKDYQVQNTKNCSHIYD